MKNIDNRAKISQNSDAIFRSLVKSLKIKFLYRMKRFVRMLSFKMRNLRGLEHDTCDQQSRGFFQSSAFRSTHPEVFYKKVALVFFNKVASLTLLKIDSGTRVFLKILQHFEGHLLCKTHTQGGFWAFLKPQNKWYNIAKIRIYLCG